jgi:hypothetical protein
MKNKILASSLALLLFVCAACVGTPFAWSSARQVKVGMTTTELTQIMGKPLTMSSSGENEVWAWNYGTGLGTGGYFAVVIKDGKVIEVPQIPDQLK